MLWTRFSPFSMRFFKLRHKDSEGESLLCFHEGISRIFVVALVHVKSIESFRFVVFPIIFPLQCRCCMTKGSLSRSWWVKPDWLRLSNISDILRDFYAKFFISFLYFIKWKTFLKIFNANWCKYFSQIVINFNETCWQTFLMKCEKRTHEKVFKYFHILDRDQRGNSSNNSSSYFYDVEVVQNKVLSISRMLTIFFRSLEPL